MKIMYILTFMLFLQNLSFSNCNAHGQRNEKKNISEGLSLSINTSYFSDAQNIKSNNKKLECQNSFNSNYVFKKREYEILKEQSEQGSAEASYILAEKFMYGYNDFTSAIYYMKHAVHCGSNKAAEFLNDFQKDYPSEYDFYNELTTKLGDKSAKWPSYFKDD